MAITFDPAKRDRTLRERGPDFADAALVCAGDTFDIEDDRRDYGETRMITVGQLRGWWWWSGRGAAAVATSSA